MDRVYPSGLTMPKFFAKEMKKHLEEISQSTRWSYNKSGRYKRKGVFWQKKASERRESKSFADEMARQKEELLQQK